MVVHGIILIVAGGNHFQLWCDNRFHRRRSGIHADELRGNLHVESDAATAGGSRPGHVWRNDTLHRSGGSDVGIVGISLGEIAGCGEP